MEAELAKRLSLSEPARAELRAALRRGAGLVLGSVFFFLIPSVLWIDRLVLVVLPLFAVATMPVTLAERWLIRRERSTFVAFFAALAVLYTVEALHGGGFGEGFGRLGLE